MADNSNKDSGVAHDQFWVGKESLEAVSLFSTDGAAKIPRCLIGKKEDLEINLPTISDKICLRFSASRVPMYEAVFSGSGF